MLVSQKCQYALRAIFELAKRNGSGPAKIVEIAREQAIPRRFLEVILRQLKQGGFVQSRRGKEGGYLLTRSPVDLTVGEVMRFIQGPIGPIVCVTSDSNDMCPLHGSCVFLPMWEKARNALASVYDTTTFQSMVEDERSKQPEFVPCYAI